MLWPENDWLGVRFTRDFCLTLLRILVRANDSLAVAAGLADGYVFE